MYYKIIVISYSLSKGGAALAAKKFLDLLKLLGYEFTVISQDDAGIFQFLKRLISHFIVKLQYDGNQIKHSLNLFSYKEVLRSFKNNDDMLHHLHWVNNDTLSIFDFRRIPYSAIVTLHDEWIFCGAEHIYNIDNKDKDFITGYNSNKKGLRGLNWNYLIWTIKLKYLRNRKDLIYTVPSSWMMQRARSSAILKNSDIRLLPNPINTETFKPNSATNNEEFRKQIGIEKNSFVFAYGAIKASKNKLKGLQFLESALRILRSRLSEEMVSKIVLVEFGGTAGKRTVSGFSIITLGHISETTYLSSLYSAADCVIVPSMVESFGQVAAEALSCATPVVCFNTSGLLDIVKHNVNGLVAESFSEESLAYRLFEFINMPMESRTQMGQTGRDHVIENFSYTVVSKTYNAIIEDALAKRSSQI